MIGAGVLECLSMGVVFAAATLNDDDAYVTMRQRMVDEQIRARGIRHPAVLSVMRRVPRHLFVPDDARAGAYEDWPLAIGFGQTISQPFIVAFMTAALQPQPTDRVLEIGTGSGYQAAILAELVAEVFSIEIVEALALRADHMLKALGYKNVRVRHGDGYQGWPGAAPFDAIIVTCAPEDVPPALVEQLREGGRMIIPITEPGGAQTLVLLRKTAGALERRHVLPVRFVPMVRGRP